MKRLFHPVAVLLVGLVAMQPALAGLLCAAPAAPCPMAITDMGPSCGLASQSSDGSSRLAVHPVSRTQASVALPATTKASAPATATTPFEALPEPRPSLSAAGRAPAEASSPPIYIRNRVFRI